MVLRPLRLLLLFLLLASSAHASTNQIKWLELQGPLRARTGQPVTFTATVTNIGRASWTDDHYFEVRDEFGAEVAFPRIGHVEPGDSKTLTFQLPAPPRTGTYRYLFRGMQNGLEYFGPTQGRSVRVEPDSTSAPYTSVSGPNYVVQSTTRSYSFTAHLPTGSLDAVEIAWRTPAGNVASLTGWIPVSPPAQETLFEHPLTFDAGPGEYSVWLNLRDTAGNVRDAWKDQLLHERYSIIVLPAANTAPDWTITRGASFAAPADTKHYSFTAHDPNANLSEFQIVCRTPSGQVLPLTSWLSTGDARAKLTTTLPVRFDAGEGRYELWIAARDSEGLVRDPAHSEAAAERLAIQVGPPPPVLQATSSLTETSFVAHWSASPGATHYRVQIARSPTFPPASLIADVDLGAAFSFHATHLVAGNTYYYRVIPYNRTGVPGEPAVSSAVRTATPHWSWEKSLVGTAPQRDLILRARRNDTPTFEFLLGAGGAIEAITYLPRQLELTVPKDINATDGVLQWLTWANGDTFKTFASPADPEHGEQFNQNQAGADYDRRRALPPVFSPIVRVSAPPDESYVAVYARQQEQWKHFTRDRFRAKFPSYTRYDLLADGVLKIRRVVLIGTFYKNEAGAWRPHNTIADGLYWENYTPFDSNPRTKPDAAHPWTAGFNAYSHLPRFGFDSHGRIPTGTYWQPTEPNRDYRSTPVAHTRGFSVAFNKDRHPTYGPALGVIFGKSEERYASTPAVDGIHILNYKNWGLGFAILPAIGLGRNLEAGDGTQLDARGNPLWGAVVDYTLYLTPNDALDDSFLEKLDRFATADPTRTPPPPTLYGPSHNFADNPELARIVANLRDIARDHFEGAAIDLPDWNQHLQHPTRTKHLGNFLP